MEQWTELIFTVEANAASRAQELCSGCTAAGLYIEDYSDMEAMLPVVGPADYIDPELAARNRKSAAIHLYVGQDESVPEIRCLVGQKLKGAGIAFTETSAALPQTDWANDWKKQHHAHRVAKRLVLCPSWESWEKQAGDVVMTIDPGGAFGSGEDVTTRLCLRLLDEALAGDERVLDMGCGSGVLAVAALLLGAKSALGVDIDQKSATEAPDNARKNGVLGRFEVKVGNVLTDAALEAALGEGFDLICGNMVADLQLDMAPLYRKKLAPSGRLLISGIIEERADEVLSAMDAAGLQLLETVGEPGWLAFSLGIKREK